MIYEDILQKLTVESRLRVIPETSDGIDLVTNDYMGLGARYREFSDEFHRRFGDTPMSASASRLLQRNQKQHAMLESYLDSLYGKRTLLFNSGYHANTGALSSLSAPGVLIVSDKLSHASMIDGIRLGQGDSARFRHNDMESLRRILKQKAPLYRQIVIATESVFSMDGDMAPLHELVELKKEFPGTLLYVDEAHAFGVFGDKGLGLSEELGLLKEIDILVGTFGKAAAGSGAFIASSELMRDYLLNSARSFIFSTALPPSAIAWNLLMTEHLTEMKEERIYLRELSRWMRSEIEAITGVVSNSRSQILPVHAGSAERAIFIAYSLRKSGYDVLPIRRPTVAAGSERIRLSLSASLNREKLKPLLAALKNVINSENFTGVQDSTGV